MQRHPSQSDPVDEHEDRPEMARAATGGEPVVVVPVGVWEQMRRMVSHVGALREQLGYVARELDSLIAAVDGQQGQ